MPINAPDAPSKPKPLPLHVTPARASRQRLVEFFSGYFWFIFKNVIGWMLILISPLAGMTVPGPGGIPLFLIGFALVTFPGKRKLTSRVMRGRGLPIEMQVFTFATALVAIVVTCVLMYLLADRAYDVLQKVNLDPRQHRQTLTAIFGILVVTGLFSLGATWLVMRLSLKVLNYVMRGIPILRRKMRPWLRKKGLILLPSRRKHAEQVAGQPAMVGGDLNEEILEIDERYQRRFQRVGRALLPWAKRAIAVAVTVAIFYFILRPIDRDWDRVRDRLLSMNPLYLLVASGMFAVFLFAFRALVWRSILSRFGHTLPVAPAVRIWSTSELARYVPGAVLQVAGRIWLSRPYGVSGPISSVSQLLELAIFLLANLIVAVGCLGYYGFKEFDGHARAWLIGSAILLPVLLGLLHTKIFYGVTNAVLARFNKPKIVERVRGRMLPVLLGWNVLGLLWQALALFVLMFEPLGLKLSWLWTLMGAYSLAWCAGFLAFWAPGGIGVRELVFIGAMKLVAPPEMRSTEYFDATLAFLSVLTRVWAVFGEIILAGLAHALDLRGAFGHPDAPGRVAPFSSH
jgi:uncharacterized membrane protein YbhN (UPF0104 family)